MRVEKQNSDFQKKYRLFNIQEVAKTSNSTVYKGQRRQDGLEVAIKIVTPKNHYEKNSVIREAKLLSRINHPNIIKMYDYFQDKSNYIMCMELGNPQLRSCLQSKSTISNQTILDYAYQIAKAMAYLHQNKILHLDLKPENIILINKSIRIIDFGEALSGPSYSKLGKEVRVTFNYCPPNIFDLSINNKEEDYLFDTKFDIWSYGVIIYQLVLSQSLFDGGNKVKVKDQMSDFEKNWENWKNDISQKLKKNEIFYQILKSTLSIEAKNRMQFNEIVKLIENFKKKQAPRPQNNPYIRDIDIIPPNNISEDGSEDNLTTEVIMQKKMNAIQSRNIAIKIRSYIDYYKFRLYQASSLSQIIHSADRNINYLPEILTKIELSIVKFCILSTIYQLHFKLSQIVRSEWITFPDGSSVQPNKINTMYRNHYFAKELKPTYENYINWKKQFNQVVDKYKINITTKDGFKEYDEIKKQLLNQPVFDAMYSIKSCFHISRILKKYVMKIENLNFQSRQLKQVCIRNIYDLMILCAIDRNLPVYQFHNKEIFTKYNEIKNYDGDRRIKEILYNTLFSLD